MSLRVKVLTIIYKTLHVLFPSLSSTVLLFSIPATQTSLQFPEHARFAPTLGHLNLLLFLLLSQTVVCFTHSLLTDLCSKVSSSVSLSSDTLFKIANWPTFPSPYVSPLPYLIFIHSIYTV